MFLSYIHHLTHVRLPAVCHAAVQSLNCQLASKDEDLQSQQERCDAKDEQIADSAQRVEQLESTVEAHKVETMRQQPQSHDWAVDVSLDKGIGGMGPAPMMPSSPRALRQRVLILEVNFMNYIENHMSPDTAVQRCEKKKRLRLSASI